MNPKVVQTIMEMLHDRGYEVDNNFDSIIGKKGDQYVKVYYIDLPKIGIKNINEIIEDMETNQIDRGIIVSSSVLSSFGKQLLTENKNIQLFHEDELSFNITHHELVPQHIIVSKSEAKEIMRKYSISEKQLPRILNTDPVCRYHGGCPGDLFKIYRVTNDSKSITYRLCV